MGDPILLTGATGFIGAAIAREIIRRGRAGELRAMVHDRPVTPTDRANVISPRADLSQPETLRGLCDGVGTLVHAAVMIGDDYDACMAVNYQGTKALLREAHRAGVDRIIHVSTAAVYGDGPHRGVTESQPPAPVSPTSRSRLAAEEEVLAVGGTVLRPMFVMGSGDTWFLSNLWRMTERLNAWIDRGDAMLSCISVDRLAEVVADLATGERRVPTGTVYHANHPLPVRVQELVCSLAKETGKAVPHPSASLNRQDALSTLPPRVGRQLLRLFAEDRWFDSTRLWTALGTSPGQSPVECVHHYTDWYLQQMQESPW